MALHHRKVGPPQKSRVLMNKNIYFKTIILINELGERVGEIDTKEALAIAQSKDLDLIVINEKSSPPIAKIIDYGKHLYNQKRKSRESKKKSAFTKVKSISVKPQISDHDLKWKSDQAITWLQNGDRLQFTIRAFGRIGTKVELINLTYERFVELIKLYGAPQGNLKRISYNQYEVYFVPIKNVILKEKEKKLNE